MSASGEGFSYSKAVEDDAVGEYCGGVQQGHNKADTGERGLLFICSLERKGGIWLLPLVDVDRTRICHCFCWGTAGNNAL